METLTDRGLTALRKLADGNKVVVHMPREQDNETVLA